MTRWLPMSRLPNAGPSAASETEQQRHAGNGERTRARLRDGLQRNVVPAKKRVRARISRITDQEIDSAKIISAALGMSGKSAGDRVRAVIDRDEEQVVRGRRE